MFHKQKDEAAATDNQSQATQSSSAQQKESKTMNAQNNQAQDQNRPLDIPGSNPYQQRGTGNNFSATAGAAGRGRKLIIGEGINLSGQIEACDHLIVEGTVEAELRGAQMLEIFESGVYYGTGEIEQATIAGRFEGDITVSGRLVVKSSGVIVGSVTYGELAVEAGATIDGKISPLTAVAASKKGGNAGPAVDFSKGKAAARSGSDAANNEMAFNNKEAANG